MLCRYNTATIQLEIILLLQLIALVLALASRGVLALKTQVAIMDQLDPLGIAGCRLFWPSASSLFSRFTRNCWTSFFGPNFTFFSALQLTVLTYPSCLLERDHQRQLGPSPRHSFAPPSRLDQAWFQSPSTLDPSFLFCGSPVRLLVVSAPSKLHRPLSLMQAQAAIKNGPLPDSKSNPYSTSGPPAARRQLLEREH